MQTQLVKTTVELDPYVLYMVKKKALEEGKTLRQIFHESLEKHIGITKRVIKNKPKIGGYSLGGVKGSLRRVDIYDYI